MLESSALIALKAQPYFKSLDDAELNRLAQFLVDRAFDQDQLIFLEGEPCQGLYIVRTGNVKVYKLSAEGREQVLTTLGANGSFNEVAVFDGGANPANVAALAPTQIWILPRAPIIDLIKRRPDVAMAIIQNLGLRLRQMIELVEDLSLRQVSARLAKLLLETASSHERVMTQQEMAARLGTVREMIGRSLKQLETRGLIKIERGKVVILDRGGLEKLI